MENVGFLTFIQGQMPWVAGLVNVETELMSSNSIFSFLILFFQEQPVEQGSMAIVDHKTMFKVR